MRWSDYAPVSRVELTARIQRAVQAAVRAAVRHEMNTKVLPRLDELDRQLLAVEDNVTEMGVDVATDRDLIEKMAAVLPVLAEAVRSMTVENAQLKAENAQLKGDAATDEAADSAAIAPVADALDALLAQVQPAAPDVTPVGSVEDVPAVVEETPAEGDSGEQPPA